MTVSVDKVGMLQDGKRVLEGVSFTVGRGQVLSIIGPNGAGKSTLIRIMAGLLKPAEGNVLLEGVAITRMPPRAIARRIGYVPQSPPANLPFTVGEFVAMARYVRSDMLGGLDAEGRAAVDHALELTGCTAVRAQAMHTLSGGEARKVHLAAALAQGADILLLDEPTTHLDYRHQREVAALLQRAKAERELTIIAVQHDLNQGVLQSDLVLALKEGREFYLGAPDALTQGDTLERLFDTPFDILPMRQGSFVAPRHD